MHSCGSIDVHSCDFENNKDYVHRWLIPNFNYYLCLYDDFNIRKVVSVYHINQKQIVIIMLITANIYIHHGSTKSKPEC